MMVPTTADSTLPLPQERLVLVVITGGTICMQDSPDGLVPTRDFINGCLRSKSDFNDGSSQPDRQVTDENGQLTAAPTLRTPCRSSLTSTFRYSVLEFAELIDSSSMDGQHWNKIVRCLQANYSNFDAFVILHGTDTLAYTASALSFMLGAPLQKTVIITGSQYSMYVQGSDAHENLLDSLTMAATYMIPEVSVIFHRQLHRATRVTKVSAFNLAAFATPNSKPLAEIFTPDDGPWQAMIYSYAIRAVSGRDPRQLTTGAVSDDVTRRPTRRLNTNHVAVLKVYPGISEGWIKGILRTSDLGGLVIETFGAGNIPMSASGSSLLDNLADAVDRGIVVVSVTQCLTGSVTSAYESARKMERRGILAGLDMTTEAAYTKLAYLLALQDLSRDDVRNKMRENLRGELTSDFKPEQALRDRLLVKL